MQDPARAPSHPQITNSTHWTELLLAVALSISVLLMLPRAGQTPAGTFFLDFPSEFSLGRCCDRDQRTSRAGGKEGHLDQHGDLVVACVTGRSWTRKTIQWTDSPDSLRLHTLQQIVHAHSIRLVSNGSIPFGESVTCFFA